MRCPRYAEVSQHYVYSYSRKEVANSRGGITDLEVERYQYSSAAISTFNAVIASLWKIRKKLSGIKDSEGWPNGRV